MFPKELDCHEKAKRIENHYHDYLKICKILTQYELKQYPGRIIEPGTLSERVERMFKFYEHLLDNYNHYEHGSRG